MKKLLAYLFGSRRRSVATITASLANIAEELQQHLVETRAEADRVFQRQLDTQERHEASQRQLTQQIDMLHSEAAKASSIAGNITGLLTA